MIDREAEERARQTMEVNRLAAIARARENQANAELRAKLTRFPDLNEPGLAHAVLSANGSLTGPFTSDPTKMRCGATGPRPLSGVPLCCELDAGHKGPHSEAGATWTDGAGAPPAGFEERGSPLAEGFTVAIKLLGLADEVLALAEALERDDLVKIGTALRGLSKATIDERALAWERGRRHGADEERERIGRQLEIEAEKAQEIADGAQVQAIRESGRAVALRGALVVVRGVAGPTPVEG